MENTIRKDILHSSNQTMNSHYQKVNSVTCCVLLTEPAPLCHIMTQLKLVTCLEFRKFHTLLEVNSMF